MRYHQPRHLLRPLALALLLLGGLLAPAAALAVQDTGVLRVAVLKSFPPMYQTNDQGQPDGFAPEIIRDILSRAGFRPTWVAVDDWNDMVSALAEGRADLSLLSPSPERQTVLAFGPPLLTSPMALLTRSEGSGIRGVADLVYKSVAFMEGSLVPETILGMPGVRLVRGRSLEQNLFALLAGEVDAVAAGKLELQYLVDRANLGHLVRFQPGPDFEFKRSLAVAKDRRDLLARLAEPSQALVSSPGYQDLVDRWYGAPHPYWTVQRLALAFGGLLALTLAALWFWHYRAMLRFNRGLSRSLRQAEAARTALGETSRLLETLVQASPLALCVLDRADRVLLWNPAAQALFGWTSSEVIGGPLPFVPEGSKEESHRIISRVLSGESFSGVELRRKRKDGILVDVRLHTAPLRDPGGRVEGVLGLMEDVTGRKQVEEARRKSEERLELALAATNDGIWDWDLATDKVYRSPNDLALLDYPPDSEMDHSTWISHVFAEDRERAEALLHAHLAGGPPFEARYRVRTRDGRVRWILSRGMVVARDPDGNSRRVVGTHQDVSSQVLYEEELAAANEELAATNEELLQTNDELMAEILRRRQVEEALRAATAQAEAASRTKSEFLANMSHEIRTPLNGMLGMLQLLRDTIQSPEQDECTGTALDSGRHLLTILNDILDFSQMEAGALRLTSEPLDVAKVLAAVGKLFSPVCRARGLEFSFHVDPALDRPILGDPARLRQVLFNLVGNAVKFTDQGFVRVEAYPLPPTRPGEARVFFSVSDTGIGIADEQLPGIFQPFTQADGSLTRRHQGTGLGLSIVKRLVELMGGNVVLESEPGKGCTVSFCIRARDGNAVPDQAAEPLEHARCPALRVLVVEDDTVNRTLTARFLGKLGHSAAQAENGQEALERLHREDFDCVLMDVQMPVLDGIAATLAIRAKPGLGGRERIPVIALTAHAMLGDRERCLEAGMDGYLSKPVDLEELSRALRLTCTGI
jgi:PAS domain S-box-containing protein